jgi:hypothetical protein
MTTHTAHLGFHLDASHAARPMRPLFMPVSQTPVAQNVRVDWLTRLADWAERQPQHHRLGCWTLQR